MEFVFCNLDIGCLPWPPVCSTCHRSCACMVAVLAYLPAWYCSVYKHLHLCKHNMLIVRIAYVDVACLWFSVYSIQTTRDRSAYDSKNLMQNVFKAPGQNQQTRVKLLKVTVIWYVSKYKVHKLCQMRMYQSLVELCISRMYLLRLYLWRSLCTFRGCNSSGI